MVGFYWHFFVGDNTPLRSVMDFNKLNGMKKGVRNNAL